MGSSALQISTLFFFCLSDVRAAREQINLGGVTYPTLPLQDAGPRPQSMYGQASVACSPTVAFARPLPPQPHSSYFSGMTGPQHPFYNRVRQEVTLTAKEQTRFPHDQPIIFCFVCVSDLPYKFIILFSFLLPSLALFSPTCVSPAKTLLPPCPLIYPPIH